MSSDMTKYTLPYRQLLCDVIKQAIDWTRGRNMSTCFEQYKSDSRTMQKRKAMQEAKEYIKSSYFEEDCGLLGIDHRPIRARVIGTERKKHKLIYESKEERFARIRQTPLIGIR